jgi:hypothetical protein
MLITRASPDSGRKQLWQKPKKVFHVDTVSVSYSLPAQVENTVGVEKEDCLMTARENLAKLRQITTIEKIVCKRSYGSLLNHAFVAIFPFQLL